MSTVRAAAHAASSESLTSDPCRRHNVLLRHQAGKQPMRELQAALLACRHTEQHCNGGSLTRGSQVCGHICHKVLQPAAEQHAHGVHH
jgi:hypothetical protein